MKRIYLTLFFAVYTFFIPFVMVNCGAADVNYVANSQDAEANADLSSESELAACQEQEFLTQDCVDILQAEEERIATEEQTVATGLNSAQDFESCRAIESIVESETSDGIDCSTAMANMTAAYQICDELSSSEKYDGCVDVEFAMEDAVEACDTQDDSVTDDFCSTLTA